MRARRGFTLVELLVVIGIIALLISILLPALNSARKSAETVKCEAALREIGTAVTFYVNENRGWMCPAKTITTYTISYTQWTPPLDYAGQQYWYEFLAKYVTRSKAGAAATTAVDRAAARASLLWGCPAWQGYVSAAYTGGINYSQPGYGFNAFPEYTASYPGANQVIGESLVGISAGNATSVDSYDIATPSATDTTWATIIQPGAAGCTGKWYKWKPYSINGSQRALVSDAQFWLLELLPPNLTSSGQLAYGQNSQYNINTWTEPGQMLYDVYRHGRLPTVSSTGVSYNLIGGKIAYNVLYCDGHVTTLNDYASGYRAGRMRYPG